MLRALLTLLLLSLFCGLVVLPVTMLGFVHPFEWMRVFLSGTFSKLALWSCGASLAVEGGSRYVDGSPAFFVGNHQSALDIPVIIDALKGRVRFMAKHTLFRIPAFGWALTVFGYAPIHRGCPRRAKRDLDRMIDGIHARPSSWVVFPEGTRSTDGRLLPFRQGTMKICVRAGLPIVPFAIDGSHRVHRSRTLRVHPGPIRVVFGEAIPAETLSEMSSKELNEVVRLRVAGCLDRARGLAVSGDEEGGRSG
jgi:1-acyl-sn-glycerol-3-phosphate acyltransferase